MKKLLVFSLLLGISQFGIGQKMNSLLWQVKSPQGKTSYLFGTYHLIGSDYLKDHQKVANAFESSQRVVVEMVIDSSKMMELGLMALMQDTALSQLVDSADYQLLKQKLEPVLGTDLSMFDHVKPITISTLYALKIAEEESPEDFMASGQPIDLYFATIASKDGREVVPLETMEQQMDYLYNSQSVSNQARDLVEMVKEDKEQENEASEIIEAYKNEDLDKMWKISQQDPDPSAFMDVLIDKRNKSWIPKLQAQLDKGGAFIAVGALHLPGNDGLIELLRKEGYTLKPVH